MTRSPRVPPDRQWVIVRDDPNGRRSYWATMRMKWPDDIDTEQYWQAALNDAHTYKTKAATKLYCPNRVLLAPDVRLMTFGDAKQDSDARLNPVDIADEIDALVNEQLANGGDNE